MKKGFTLVELLAVIVILAIISLIATPTILKVVDNTRKSAILRSTELYLDSVKQSIVRKNLTEGFNPTECIIQANGNLKCDNNEIAVEMNGEKPIGGTIILEDGKITGVTSIILSGYELETDEDGKLTIKGVYTPKPDDGISSINLSNGYLKKSTTLEDISQLPSLNFLDGNITRESIESVSILSTNEVPKDVLGSFDASANKDKSVMAWYVDNDKNSLYELYIGGNKGVNANPDSSSLFAGFTNLKSIDLTYLYTDEVTNMSGMFAQCINLEELDLSHLDANKVTDMSSMFINCKNLVSINFENSVFKDNINYSNMLLDTSVGIIYVKDEESKKIIETNLNYLSELPLIEIKST